MDIDDLLLPRDSFDLFDPVAGTFARGGHMLIPREFHTATLLGNGNVLIVGGSECYASAELYDPVSGLSRATGTMTALRSGHTATLLNDGRVLVTGGSTTAYGAVASAEIYDPVSATFSPTGNMSAARSGHTATLLANGKVLVTGGTTDWSQFVTSANAVATAEIYDPQSGSFTLTGAMGTARTKHTATLLNDGTVLVTGGANSVPLATTELYDPQSGRFAPGASMTMPRTAQTATKLVDGKVLIVGGIPVVPAVYVGYAPTPTAEIYDPAGGGSFALAGTMADGRFWHEATLLRDGRVLVAGGGLKDPQCCTDTIPRAETYP
jgi:hypothetical protein